MLYVCLFSQSVLLLMFQFVYRYAMVTRNSFLSRLNFRKCAALCFLLFVAFAVAWTLDTHLSMGVVHEDVFAVMSGIYQRQFEGNLSAIGYLGQSYDPSANSRLWVAYFGTCNLLAMLAVSWAVIIYSGWKVYKTLHASSKVISEKTRRLQKELFKALIIQLTIPLFFNYTPMGVLFFSAMIGIPLKLELIIAWTTTTHFSMGAVGEDVSQAMRHIFTTNLGMDNIPNTGFLGQSYDALIIQLLIPMTFNYFPMGSEEADPLGFVQTWSSQLRLVKNHAEAFELPSPIRFH
ncbi:unnamed protein product, partial [Mesorhabditis spiculigera]